MNSIIIRYGEISLKGKNRSYFELRLKSEIERFLSYLKHSFSEVVLKRGRLYIRGIKKIPPLEKVFGIHSYSPAHEIEKSISFLKQEVLSFASLVQKAESFRVSCQRVDKSFKYTSMEVEKIIGEILLKKTQTPVNLTNPGFELKIEIGSDHIYLFQKKIRGYGGFPYGSAGKLVSLVSSGIDSPVATFLMMKRGVEPILVHFQISKGDFQKLKKLKARLEEFTAGREIKLVAIKRDEIFKGKFSTLYNQDQFHSYICILCKYLMHKRAGEIAREEGALGIITGDNLAQVASQTLKNLFAYRNSSDMPVYSPLIGFEKEETIRIAKEIGTFEFSVSQAKGCVPPRTPKTGVSPSVFKKILTESGLETTE